MYEWLSKVARLKTYATSNWLASMGLGPRDSTEALGPRASRDGLQVDVELDQNELYLHRVLWEHTAHNHMLRTAYCDRV